MSVYSGFATRAEEQNYAKLTETLVGLLSAKVLTNCSVHQQKDPQFGSTITKLHKKMSQLETHKHLPPKISHYFKDLAMHCTPLARSSRLDLGGLDESMKKRKSPMLPILDRQLKGTREFKKVPARKRVNKIVMSNPKRQNSTLYYERLIDRTLRADYEGNISDECYHDGLFFSKLQ